MIDVCLEMFAEDLLCIIVFPTVGLFVGRIFNFDGGIVEDIDDVIHRHHAQPFLVIVDCLQDTSALCGWNPHEAQQKSLQYLQSIDCGAVLDQRLQDVLGIRLYLLHHLLYNNKTPKPLCYYTCSLITANFYESKKDNLGAGYHFGVIL